MRTLLLGMGNPILSDDAVGVRLAAELGRRLPRRPDLDVREECSVGGLNLLDVLAGYDRVIVLDAVKTAGGAPGDRHRFTVDALADTRHLTNIHDVNLPTALELGRRLGMPLPGPAEVHVLAVEVDDISTFSDRMTEALEAAFPRLVEEVLHEVQALLEAPGPAFPTCR